MSVDICPNKLIPGFHFDLPIRIDLFKRYSIIYIFNYIMSIEK